MFCTRLTQLLIGYFNLYRKIYFIIKYFDEMIFQHVHHKRNLPAHIITDLERMYGNKLIKEDIKLKLRDKLDSSMRPTFCTSVIQEQKEEKKQK